MRKRVIIWLRVLYTYFATFLGVKSKIWDAQLTADIIQTGKSLIRFGDGELGIYKNKNIHYQEWSIELKRAFEKIKSDYENNRHQCPYLLALPKHYMQCSGFALAKKRVYISSWSESRYYFKKNFDLSLKYGDSFLFEKANKGIYSQIWNNENCPENIIFVHNSEVYAKYFAKTYNKNTVFVKCPSQNAFDDIDDLEKKIVNIINDNGWDKKQVMLTISAGPAGKVLVYRLSNQGYWCVDAGHCWDDPLES